jgi:RNA polymerase sigma-70 factor (ECF subfamily)
MVIGQDSLEDRLVRLAQQGDPSAREDLALRYRAAVRAQALRMLRNWDDAHDATQETFIKAFRALHSFQAGRPVLPWLLRICSNCCIDIMRERRPGIEALDKHEHSLGDSNDEAWTEVIGRETTETIQEAIDRLPARYREIVALRHYRDMEVGEIAALLSRPEGTVKSWLFRARAILRRDPALLVSA